MNILLFFSRMIVDLATSQGSAVCTRGQPERATRPPCKFCWHFSRIHAIFVGHYYFATKTCREGEWPAQVAPLYSCHVASLHQLVPRIKMIKGPWSGCYNVLYLTSSGRPPHPDKGVRERHYFSSTFNGSTNHGFNHVATVSP